MYGEGFWAVVVLLLVLGIAVLPIVAVVLLAGIRKRQVELKTDLASLRLELKRGLKSVVTKLKRSRHTSTESRKDDEP